MFAALVGLTSIQGSTSAPGKLIPEPSGGQVASGLVPEVRIGGPAFSGAPSAAGASVSSTTAETISGMKRKVPPSACASRAAFVARDATPIRPRALVHARELLPAARSGVLSIGNAAASTFGWLRAGVGPGWVACDSLRSLEASVRPRRREGDRDEVQSQYARRDSDGHVGRRIGEHDPCRRAGTEAGEAPDRRRRE